MFFSGRKIEFIFSDTGWFQCDMCDIGTQMSEFYSSYFLHRNLIVSDTGVIHYSYKVLQLGIIPDFQSSLRVVRCCLNAWCVWHWLSITFRLVIPWSKVRWRRVYQTYSFSLNVCTHIWTIISKRDKEVVVRFKFRAKIVRRVWQRMWRVWQHGKVHISTYIMHSVTCM